MQNAIYDASIWHKACHMARDDPHFNFRMPLEVRNKLKQRAEMNGRSMNSELLKIVNDALDKPSAKIGYSSESERLASIQSEEFRTVIFETLNKLYNGVKSNG